MPQPRDHAAIGIQYAKDVVGGKVSAGKWVRAACQRHLTDISLAESGQFPYRFDPNKGGKICRFIEQLKHIKGPKANTHIELEPWQCWILTSVWGWLHAGGPREGKRRFRRVYIEVPRGNAKSTLSSGAALYMLGADGEGGAEVYSAATTRDQARIVFRDAQHMARKSPELMRALGIEVAAHNIRVLRTASMFEALSADGDSLDGKNVHFGCIDELHAHKTRLVYDAIETGTGKRDQSLLWCITTAGSNRAGICYEVRGYLTKLLDNVAADEAFFGVIYAPDEDDDWMAEATYAKANPNWGVSVQPDVVMGLVAKAMQMPAAQNNLRTKHLDIWVNADSAWMDMAAWDRAADKTLNLADFDGESCVIALDLATKTDIAAKMRIFTREIAGATHYYAFGQYYLPESAVSDGRNAQYPGWEIAGRLTVTPGDVLDFEMVENDLIEDSSRFNVSEIAYDPWQATQLAQRLQAQGAAVIEFRNTVGNFSAPMKELDALARSGRFHHDGDEVLSWMVSNVVCHVDNKDNIYPRKERPENKIDGVVACIMALGRLMVREDDGLYADGRGLFVLQ
jgi:phage terminase large subunit-like protein